MIDKILDFEYGDNNSEVLTLVHPSHMQKVAEAGYATEIMDFIKSLVAKEGHTYALANALSAGEYYSSNRNHDYFPEEALRKYHKTFETHGGIFRHHCFVAGTRVTMSDYSQTPVEQIEKGDEVLTPIGPKKVIEVFCQHYIGVGNKLELKGIPADLYVTADHEFLVYKRNQIHCSHNYNRLSNGLGCSCSAYKNSIGSPVWVKARDILPGDYVVSPKPKHGSVRANLDFAELVGWVASEGYLNKNGSIQFTFSEGNIQDINAVISCLKANGLNAGICPRPRYGVTVITSCSRELSNKLSQYISGVLSEKVVFDTILSWDEESLLRFLGAYISGDGCVTSTNKNMGQLRIRSSSQGMLNILSIIIRSLGINCNVNYDRDAGEMLSPTNNKIYNHSGSGVATVGGSFSPILTKFSRKHQTKDIIKTPTNLLYNDHYLIRVVDNEIIALDEPVYNIEVEDEHVYLVENVLVHNCNKNPKISMGKIVMSFYNGVMHRVELVLEFINDRATDIIEGLLANKPAALSMGCRVPADFCSICGNRARTRAEYCDHLKNHAGEIMPDGTKIYAINREPTFFDISKVTIPADRTAGLIAIIKGAEKVASKSVPNLQSKSGTDSMQKFAEEVTASIDKTIETVIDPKYIIIASQKKLSKDKLVKLSTYPIDVVLSTLAGLRIIPLPEDFQKLALYTLGFEKEADLLEKEKYLFSFPNEKETETVNLDLSSDKFNTKVAEIIGDDVCEMSLTKPLILARIFNKVASTSKDSDLFTRPEFRVFPSKEKERSFLSKLFTGNSQSPDISPIKSPIVPLGVLGMLYSSYAQFMNKFGQSANVPEFRNFMLKYPWLAPVTLTAIAAGSSLFLQKQTIPIPHTMQKEAGIDRFIRNMFISVPVSYYLSADAESRAQRGIPISSVENILRKHPLLAGIGGSLFLGAAEKAYKNYISGTGRNIIKLGSLLSRMDPNDINQMFTETCGG